jgi:hypothetical protein
LNVGNRQQSDKFTLRSVVLAFVWRERGCPVDSKDLGRDFNQTLPYEKKEWRLVSHYITVKCS